MSAKLAKQFVIPPEAWRLAAKGLLREARKMERVVAVAQGKRRDTETTT